MHKKTPFALTFTLSLVAVPALAQDTMTKPAAPAMPGHDMKSSDTMQDSIMKTDTMMLRGYEVYTKAAYEKARGMQRVLFFHASWCPNCKAADADIMKNIGQLPKNTVIFKVDYDQETALKKMYGITMQHTFVLVDDKGKALKKWAGGGLKEIAMNTMKKGM